MSLSSNSFSTRNRNKRKIISACRTGNYQEVADYLSRGISPNSFNITKNTCLGYACSQGHIDILRLLIRYKVNLQGHGLYPKSCLYIVLEIERYDMAEVLIAAGAETNSTVNIGMSFSPTLLNQVSSKGKLDQAQFLLYRGADPNFRITRQHPRLNNTDPNSQFEGDVALLIAMRIDHWDLAKLLLNMGADRKYITNTDKLEAGMLRLLDSYPLVPSLVTLAIRAIRSNGSKNIPTWLPPVLLEWPEIQM